MSGAGKEQRFWVVWNDRGQTPTVRHYSREHADAEATRLAAANPGYRFYVLKAVGGFSASRPAVDPIGFRPRPDFDDGIPF